MAELLINLFRILIFPGLLFVVAIGLMAGWLVRKVSALVQHRIGPPFLQPVFDVAKLLGKEIFVPDAAQKLTFIAAPFVGFSAVVLLAAMLLQNCIEPTVPFVGDVIVAIYLMVIPSLALILGASASASPHAAIGAAREMKLIMSYELPLVLAFVVAIIKSAAGNEHTGQLQLAALAQNASVFSISGLLAFIVALLCIQAKLGFVPFDIAEAETEIAGGVLIEYSGALLAVWQLKQAVMLVAMPLFLMMLFMGGFSVSAAGIAGGLAKYVLILVLIILIKNTNPRVRIDQAVKFFWFFCAPVLAVAVVLAILGNYYGLSWL